MAKTLEELKAAVLALPVGERVEVALELIKSVDDFEYEVATVTELKRRLALNDEANDIDGEELDAEFRARYGWHEPATRD
jgi:hypothetical protein